MVFNDLECEINANFIVFPAFTETRAIYVLVVEGEWVSKVKLHDSNQFVGREFFSNVKNIKAVICSYDTRKRLSDTRCFSIGLAEEMVHLETEIRTTTTSLGVSQK